MSILDKVKPPQKPDYSLSKKEIEFLLFLIKETTFKGQDVEVLYNLVYKLQQQHTLKQ